MASTAVHAYVCLHAGLKLPWRSALREGGLWHSCVATVYGALPLPLALQ